MVGAGGGGGWEEAMEEPLSWESPLGLEEGGGGGGRVRACSGMTDLGEIEVNEFSLSL